MDKSTSFSCENPSFSNIGLKKILPKDNMSTGLSDKLPSSYITTGLKLMRLRMLSS